MERFASAAKTDSVSLRFRGGRQPGHVLPNLPGDPVPAGDVVVTSMCRAAVALTPAAILGTLGLFPPGGRHALPWRPDSELTIQ